MSRREKREEKKGISLVGFVVILIILVCLEGFYIVKLRKNPNAEIIGDEPKVMNDENENKSEPVENPADENLEPSAEPNVSLNGEIISTLGYNVNVMIDSLLDSVQASAEAGNIVKYEDGVAAEEVISVENISENRENYRNIISENLDNQDMIIAVKFEKGKLTCEYNIKNVLNSLGLESKNYAELGANEENVKVFEF